MPSQPIDTLCRYGHAAYLCYQVGDKRKVIGWWSQEIAIMKGIVGEDHLLHRRMVNKRDDLVTELEENGSPLRRG